MMKERYLFIVLLCLSPLLGWSQNFNRMVESMDRLSLPLVNIEVEADSVTNEHFVPGRITIVEYNDSALATSSYNCQVRHRGMLALTLPKKSFSVKLVDEMGEKLDANLLGLRNDNTWILDAMGFDRLRMRNRVCFDIWNEFNHTMWDTNLGNRNGTVGTMVEVFINDDYNGIYCLSDKINRQLLGLKKAKVENDGSVTVRGLLYKGNGTSTTNTLLEYTDDSTDSVEWNLFELQYPDDYPSLQTWQPLMDLIDFNSQSDNQYFREHYNEWYYVDNLVDYWVFLVALGLKDMPYKNTFLSTQNINNGHQYMITPWDLDACLGRQWGGELSPEMSSLNRLDYCAPFNLLVKQNIDGFKHKLAKRWFELTKTSLSPANVESHISAYAQRLVESGAWQREFKRWINTKASVASNINEEVQYAVNWYSSNISHINAYINMWREDYDPNAIISTQTVTRMYNYLLGIDTTYNIRLDLNKDGEINTTDVALVYNFLLGIGNGPIIIISP